MTLMRAYSVLDSLGPVVTTAEAAAALRRDSSSACRLLRGLAEIGRARRIRPGLWLIGPEAPDPFSLVNELTRPFPSYVSFLSALNYHGMIDQIPREIEVASLDRAHQIGTSSGRFDIHHLPGELFGGWTRTSRGPIADPAKAIFDIAYVGAAAQGRPRQVPEIELPTDLDRSVLGYWTSRVQAPRLASLTRKGVDYILSRATR